MRYHTRVCTVMWQRLLLCVFHCLQYAGSRRESEVSGELGTSRIIVSICSSVTTSTGLCFIHIYTSVLALSCFIHIDTSVLTLSCVIHIYASVITVSCFSHIYTSVLTLLYCIYVFSHILVLLSIAQTRRFFSVTSLKILVVATAMTMKI